MNLLKKKLKTDSRLIHTLLTKYRNTFTALCELTNNSIQAKAKNVWINISYGSQDKLEPFISEIMIKDDGVGVPPSEVENRILLIGTGVKSGGQGVGRFAALQLGSKMIIKTCSYNKPTKRFHEITFALDIGALTQNPLDETEFELSEEMLTGESHASFYQVSIQNIYHSRNNNIPKRQRLTDDFKEENIATSIFQRYPLLIFNESVAFHINGKRLEREDFLLEQPVLLRKPYKTPFGVDEEVTFYFYNVKSTINKAKVFLCIENAGIQTVAHEFTYSSEWYTPDLGTWFIYLESAMFSSDLFRNIDLEDMADDELKMLKDFIKENVSAFFKERNKKFEKFVAAIDNDEANPLRNGHKYPPSHEMIFKKIAYLIEDDYQLLENKLKIREIVYPLVNTAISNGEIESIFDKVLKLSPAQIKKLHSLLEKTDLENVIHFSHQVIEKNEFIDFLNKLVYGDISKVLKERCQLHKIVEKALWIFGENYNGTPCLWSDRQIGGTLNEIRQQWFNYEPSLADENLIESSTEISGLNDITDLFFYNEKILDDERREILIVELKSPKCAISMKEINQLDRYAYTIEKQNALPSSKVKYKIILISSKLTGFAKSKMASAFTKYQTPFLYDKKEEKDIEMYVVEWRDLIESNKRKLNYLSNGIESKEKNVREKFEEEYPHLIDDEVRTILRKTKEKI